MQVYEVLADHQQKNATGWDMEGLIQELHRWKEILTFEFKLEIPPVAFCIKNTRSNCYGYFRPGHNEFGLTREIAINKTSLACQASWEIIGTLFHELLHAHQDAFGKPGKRNYHNVEFRRKARTYGLVVDSRGFQEYLPEAVNRFLQLLKKHGVDVPDLLAPAQIVGGNGSKLKLWECGCTKVRVAVADFHAVCLNCNQEFARQG